MVSGLFVIDREYLKRDVPRVEGGILFLQLSNRVAIPRTKETCEHGEGRDFGYETENNQLGKCHVGFRD